MLERLLNHFYASATKHLGIGMSVGWSVGWSVGFDTNFKKVPKMIYAPRNKFCMIWGMGPLRLVR